MLKKLLIILLSINLLLCNLNAYAENNLVQGLKDETVNYYKVNHTNLSSWWELGALYGAGQNVSEAPWNLSEWESDPLPQTAQATDFAGRILGSLIVGVDPKNELAGRNIVEELVNKQKDNGSFGLFVNAHAWAMLALDRVGENYNVDAAITWLSTQKKADGGFALSGKMSDPDVTAMVLLALSNHKNNPVAAELINSIVNYLLSIQLDTAGFKGWDEENSNSTSSVISGLVAVGEDVMSQKWQKNGLTMVDALAKFKLEDGSYKYLLDDDETNNMSTYQSLIAFGDVLRGKSVWNTLKIHKDEEEIADAQMNDINLKVRIEGTSQNILSEDITIRADRDNVSAYEAIKYALDDKKIFYTIDDEVKRIGNDEIGMFGGRWYLLVNKIKSEYRLSEQRLLDGDELILYYGVEETAYPVFEVINADILSLKITANNKPVEDASVVVNAQTFKTDENGIAKIEGDKGTYKAKVFKTRDDGCPLLIREEIELILPERKEIIKEETDIVKIDVAKKKFVDMKSFSDWALEGVMIASENGIIEGDEQNRFNPKAYITRAEFCKMAVKLLKLDTSGEFAQEFSDVDESDWFFSYVMEAKKSGIINGNGEEFKPNDTLTRQEMAAIINRAFAFSGFGQKFEDDKDIAPWAKEAAYALSENKIMLGSGGRFDPLGNVSREMAAVVMARLIGGVQK